MPAVRYLLALLCCCAALLHLTSCDRVKAKVKSILDGAAPKSAPQSAQPSAPLPTAEESMNQAAEGGKVFDTSVPATTQPMPEPGEPEEEVVEINKSALVSILGYHDFRDRGGSPMIIAGPKFRQQMQAIKDSKIPVVPLSDVLAWKRGEKNIPDECIVITMDDGWQGVYSIAYPILKEYGFPFTVYIYKKYVNIGGRSMKWVEIKEMMQHGCEVGSHCVTHDALTKKGKMNDQQYQLWLLNELQESKQFLEANLGTPVLSVAYPYGNHNDMIVQLTHQVGYEAAVTVANTKVAHDTPNGKLGRYIIHGEQDGNFNLATTFRSRGGLGSSDVLANDAKAPDGSNLFTLLPAPNATVPERRPVIEAHLAKVESIVPESIKVRVSGFGLVPYTFNKETFIVRYQPPIKMRDPDVNVTISFKRALEAKEELVSWHFKVDLAASYLPLPGAVPKPPTPVGSPSSGASAAEATPAALQ
jgi:peptidoglycan/xylan/chitin deacetylase (PgdA/CDA1 family)